ncbi:MAG TPA: hypothetical protein PL105_18475, partial [Caldilineaceae bacterium]|nr:hypothetical protein [Caldilineaceae bacterium]
VTITQSPTVSDEKAERDERSSDSPFVSFCLSGSSVSSVVTAHPHPTSPKVGEESIHFPPWNGEG